MPVVDWIPPPPWFRPWRGVVESSVVDESIDDAFWKFLHWGEEDRSVVVCFFVDDGGRRT